jgi:hypothetical protein
MPKIIKKPESKRANYELLRAQLENERSSFLSHWRDLGDYILPRRPRFNTTDANRGQRVNQKIIDSTATLAARTLRSGMMGGITSPARPWFRLTTPDPELAEFGPVKEWLHTTTLRTSSIFLRSNLYNCLPVIYGDIGVFAISAMNIEEDFEDVVRFYPHAIGSYMIATNDKLKVDVFFREFRMTVRQMIKRFGQLDKSGQPDWTNFSEHVKNLWENNSYETWIDICHVVMPNESWDDGKLAAKFKKFKSIYYEKGTSGQQSGSYIRDYDEEKVLRESGYDYFPILAPRWETTGEDVYGTSCPGMDSLGDVKALQLMHKRKAQAIEKMVNPPMVAPNALKNSRPSILPGDITYLDTRNGMQGFQPAHEVNPRINELVLDIQEHQERVRRAFYEDLFLMISQSDRREITAREIEERHEEKLLALGPVLEQLNQDLLDPLIDITFNIMVRQNLIPTPPEELQGMPLRVEYVSIMAQAQKLVGISGLERLAGFVGNLSSQTGDLTILDKVDVDQLIDEYADALSVPPRVIRPDDEVEKIKESRAQAQQAQQTAEIAQAAGKTAKDLSQTDTGGDNALTRLLKQAKAGEAVPQQ